MMLDPRSAVGRFVAVSLVVFVVVLIWQAGVDPIASAFSERWEARAELEESLEAYRRRSGSLAELTRQRDELQSRQGGQIGLMIEANAALAGAALQASVRRILDSNGGALRSLQALQVRTEGDLQRIAVRVDATVPSGRLLDFLYATETANPYLFIDSMDVRVPDNLPRESSGHAQVALRAEIAAYRRPEAQ